MHTCWYAHYLAGPSSSDMGAYSTNRVIEDALYQNSTLFSKNWVVKGPFCQINTLTHACLPSKQHAYSQNSFDSC